MRDLLTFLAGLLVLVLVAALAVPPFIDWREHRALVEEAVSRASGLPVATEGSLDVRLLPSPRLRIERMRLGDPAPDAASLDAHYVRAEIALTPLLRGEVRFLDSRIGRLEVKLPTGAGGNWRVKRALLSEDALRHAWVFENLSVLQLFVTTVDPGTGRTDQVYAEGVRVESQSLAGPWRLEGQMDGTRFALATGAIDAAGPTNVKLSAGGDGQPRFAFDGRLAFVPAADDTLAPALEGSVRLAAGPEAGAPFPIAVAAQAKAAGRLAELEAVTIEAGEGGATARLSGTGRAVLDELRVSLALEGRRIDLDALLRAAGRAPPGFRAGMKVPVDATLKLDGLLLGGEELSGLTARGTVRGDRLSLASLDVTAPGGTQIAASGEIGLAPGGGAEGRVAVNSRSADRFVAWLGRLGLGPVPAGFLEGRAAEASADIVAAHPVASLRNIRVAIGESAITGALRFTAAEGSARARLDAQLGIQNLDLTALPVAAGLFETARAVDLGLILDARNVGYGSPERGGRIAARLRSEGAALAVERIEIADLAGANASLSGSLAADGSGRIAGRLTALRAAPLIDLVGRVWFGPIAELLPPFLRDGRLDLGVTAERVGGGALVTKLSGTASGGPLEAEITAADGRTRALAATLSTARTGTWLGLPDAPALARPARLQVTGARDPGGALALRVAGEIGGVRIAARQPLRLAAGEDEIDAGEIELAAEDVAPLLSAFGSAGSGPVPLALVATVGRVAGVPRVGLAGRVAGTAVEADLFGASRAEIGGTVSLGRLSLPWLAAALAVPPQAGRDAGGAAPWPTVRFAAPPPAAFGGAVAVSTASLDLGRGLVGTAARFDLATVPDGFAVRALEAGLLGGTLKGGFTLTRQGGLAALIGEGAMAGVELPRLAGAPFLAGRLSAELRFGGSGESPAGLVSNLGGAGTLAVDGLQVAGVDPGAVERAASRAIRSDDPLSQPQLAALATEELGRSPFAAPRVAGQASLVGGAVRVSPLVAAAEAGTWQGALSLDLRNNTMDLRGSLTSKTAPRGWAGALPVVALGWAGPVGRPTRSLDIAPLVNALASVVLARELERIEIFELDAAERARINARLEMDRARKAAEEAARLARIRAEEAERARLEAERIRLDAERLLNLPPPIDIRPGAPSAPAPPPR